MWESGGYLNCCTLWAYEKGGLAILWKGGKVQKLKGNRGGSVLPLERDVAYVRLSLVSLARWR